MCSYDDVGTPGVARWRAFVGGKRNLVIQICCQKSGPRLLAARWRSGVSIAVPLIAGIPRLAVVLGGDVRGVVLAIADVRSWGKSGPSPGARQCRLLIQSCHQSDSDTDPLLGQQRCPRPRVPKVAKRPSTHHRVVMLWSNLHCVFGST